MTVHRGSVNRENFLNDFNLQLVGFLDEEHAGKEATLSFSTVTLQMERHKFLPQVTRVRNHRPKNLSSGQGPCSVATPR